MSQVLWDPDLSLAVVAGAADARSSFAAQGRASVRCAGSTCEVSGTISRPGRGAVAVTGSIEFAGAVPTPSFAFGTIAWPAPAAVTPTSVAG